MVAPTAILAIDPGDKYVGVASWIKDSTEAVVCAEVQNRRAVETLQTWLKGNVEQERRVVIEEFRLYRHKAMTQSGSAMETSQLIGQLKYVAAQEGVEVVEQGAGIKKPTRAQLRARGIKQVGRGGHARDAELHLMYYTLKEDLWPTRRI